MHHPCQLAFRRWATVDFKKENSLDNKNLPASYPLLTMSHNRFKIIVQPH